MTTRWMRLAMVVTLASPGRATAQTVPVPQMAAGGPAATTVTLEEAIARGLANSQRLAELEARSAAAAASEQGRAAARLPLLSAIGGYTRTNHVTAFSLPAPGVPTVIYPDVPDNYHTRLDVQW